MSTHTVEPGARTAAAHERFASAAARTPHAVAVELGAERVTYAGLDARACRLARRLRRLGVGPDGRVALALERSVEMVVAVLAVLKAGGCYVPVDPAYPAGRIAHMLADSRASVLVTTSALAARLPAGAYAVLAVDADADLIGRESSEPPPVEVGPESLAYVLYTSGSTGLPKGAALPHRALANLLRWQVARWGDGAAARTLQFSSLSFDVSFQEIFSTWCAGGTLVLVDDDTRRDAQALLAYLREARVERLFLPFAALQNLAEVGVRTEAELPHLREVITAGEALRATPQLRAFFRMNPRARLENQYGPSETHVVSAHLLPADPDAWPPLPPIGAPVEGAGLHVLDARLDASAPGEEGELHASGAALARGYLARPALTAERFVPSPFGPAGARLYRTGDRARWTPDGELEYLGRTDAQVKVRGYRVELGEVEASVASHPAVHQAAVAAHGDGAAKRLVAYVVSLPGRTAQAASLRAHVAARLPEHMVPAAWVALDALPLTPSGKVDRRALPEPA
ncbi:MAG: pksN [Gemmatimonadetes bacterium]|nr:pksN [Gemmatimonadota bacterium]